jgi:hypothetical protein
MSPSRNPDFEAAGAPLPRASPQKTDDDGEGGRWQTALRDAIHAKEAAMGWRLMMAAASLALVASAASADVVHYTTRLTSRAEAPTTRSGAIGELQADYDTDTRLLVYKLTYQGLSGPATGARFQGPAKPGQTAPPVVTVSDAANPISGNATLTADQAAALQSGLWYVNITTAANPDGEIRGQLKRVVNWARVESPSTPPPPMQTYQPPASLSAR